MGLQETLDGAKKIQGDCRRNKMPAACIACSKVAMALDEVSAVKKLGLGTVLKHNRLRIKGEFG